MSAMSVDATETFERPLTAASYAHAHLRQAEREVSWLRWLGMASWALILLRDQFTVAPEVAWAIYAGGVLYTGFAHYLIESEQPIGPTAWLTTVGDPVIAALICFATGGVGSIFYPFFYFTLLATAFRYGAREALLMLGFNSLLTAVLFWTTPGAGATAGDFIIAVYYLLFSALLGVMLAHWARENLDLALVRSEALRHAGERARTLLQRLIHAQEAERKHVAGEIHDRLGGRLFALQQGIDACAAAPDATPALRRSLEGLAREARGLTADVRSMMNDLRPTVLDEFGLCEALSEYVSQLACDAPFEIALDLDPALKHWRGDGDAMLFRIAQESLLNVRKHARAKRVSVSLVCVDGDAVLTIADDGEGFDPDSVGPRHFGLLTMRERAEALGGRVEVRSAWGEGTKVIARVPAGPRV